MSHQRWRHLCAWGRGWVSQAGVGVCARCLHRGGSACPCSGPLARVYMLRVRLLACIQCMCVSD